MVKGGFQGFDITGVDLTAQSPTLPGAYAACAGADGKPIRVQTADGQVECSVKKVSTDYVLAGITGDGKILSITIGSTDGISVSEMTISSGGYPDYILDYGNKVDLSSYTTDNRFKAPGDGYVWIVVGTYNNTAEDYVMCNLRNKNGESYGYTSFTVQYNENRDNRSALFVKKGFEIYPTIAGAGTGAKTINFYPLVEA